MNSADDTHQSSRAGSPRAGGRSSGAAEGRAVVIPFSAEDTRGRAPYNDDDLEDVLQELLEVSAR